MKILYGISFVLLILLCAFFGYRLYLYRRNIRFINQSIEAFIKEGTFTEFSVAEGEFSRLQNNIFSLEELLLREKEYTRREAEKNREFISDISHQLKTPLAGLRLYCEMANNSVGASYTEKKLALITKMESLIRNVLKLEKIRSDSYVMSFVETEVKDIVNDIKNELLLLFPEKAINVTGSGVLRADREWLREAVENIMKNACEHTADDGIIEIVLDESENNVNITIEDNGGGVPDNELPLLFNRFHRTDSASPDSAGIGLAISKVIILKHHGTINAVNGKNGLQINMCFPVIDANVKL